MRQGTGMRSAMEPVEGWARKTLRRAPMPALIWAALFSCMPASAPAMQILEAVDHAELEAEVSNRAVSRVALAGDRIARVIRGPDGFVVEHDASRGDVYLRPADASGVLPGGTAPPGPLTLFVGTAAGFTYRLSLTVAERGSAQILIRNAAASPGGEIAAPGERSPRRGERSPRRRAGAWGRWRRWSGPWSAASRFRGT